MWAAEYPQRPAGMISRRESRTDAFRDRCSNQGNPSGWKISRWASFAFPPDGKFLPWSAPTSSQANTFVQPVGWNLINTILWTTPLCRSVRIFIYGSTTLLSVGSIPSGLRFRAVCSEVRAAGMKTGVCSTKDFTTKTRISCSSKKGIATPTRIAYCSIVWDTYFEIVPICSPVSINPRYYHPGGESMPNCEIIPLTKTGSITLTDLIARGWPAKIITQSLCCSFLWGLNALGLKILCDKLAFK